MTDERLDNLLERWDQLRRQGHDVPATELCQSCPELIGALQQRIDALKATEWLERPVKEDLVGDGTAPQHNPEAFGLLSTLGRYRLEQLIGMGGFGQVWRGFDPELLRPVAIKVARPDRIPALESRREFLAEARSVAQLEHPGIVPVFDVGIDQGHCFIVSALIEGSSLANRAQKERFTHEQAATLVADVAEALEHAHQQHFIHRDIKPANILLAANGKPFVTDFGIALRVDGPLTAAADTAGTLAYMSPEQIQGGPGAIDARTDIYSLGVVLYELLTGQVPFDGQNPVVCRDAILSGRASAPRTLDSSIPPALERICLKAMAKEPADRYATAKELANALREAIHPRQRRRWPWVICGLMVLFGLPVSAWLIRDYQHAHAVEVQAVRSGQEAVAKVDQRLQRDFGVGLDGHPRGSDTDAGNAPQHLRLSLLDSSIDLTGRSLSEEDFKQLGRQVTLTRLTLANTPTTDTELAYLHMNVPLQHLDLSKTKVSDAGLRCLSDLPALQSLSLAYTGVTDAGLNALAAMHLQKLGLRGTRISDQGLGHLTRQYGLGDSLRELDISETQVTDACIASIRLMKGLRVLRIHGTGMSDTDVMGLKAALPGCRIEQ